VFYIDVFLQYQSNAFPRNIITFVSRIYLTVTFSLCSVSVPMLQRVLLVCVGATAQVKEVLDLFVCWVE
jgi:transposase-like protein